MRVHQWKLLLCGLCHTHWKHWERWGCNRAQTLLICCLESSVFLFNLIMKLISFISICLLAGSPRIQGVFWWHSGCGIVTFLGPCKIFESPFYLLFFSLQHLSKSYKSFVHLEILHPVNLLDSIFLIYAFLFLSTNCTERHVSSLQLKSTINSSLTDRNRG